MAGVVIGTLAARRQEVGTPRVARGEFKQSSGTGMPIVRRLIGGSGWDQPAPSRHAPDSGDEGSVAKGSGRSRPSPGSLSTTSSDRGDLESAGQPWYGAFGKRSDQRYACRTGDGEGRSGISDGQGGATVDVTEQGAAPFDAGMYREGTKRDLGTNATARDGSIARRGTSRLPTVGAVSGMSTPGHLGS